MASKETLGENLSNYRENCLDESNKNKKMTQEALAHQVGISTRSYGKIERGEVNTTLEILDKIAMVTGLTASQLLDTELDLSLIKYGKDAQENPKDTL